MLLCRSLPAVLLAASVSWAVAAEDKPRSPVEARKKVGEKLTVEMTVRAAKDRLAKRGEIYLDSEPDFRNEKNFAVVITRAGAASLKQAGISNPAEYITRTRRFGPPARSRKSRKCPASRSRTPTRSSASRGSERGRTRAPGDGKFPR